jgi:hypothetical protein
MASTKVSFPTPANFDFENIKYGKLIKNEEYKRNSTSINYPGTGIKRDATVVYLKNLKVLNYYLPKPEDKDQLRATILFGISKTNLNKDNYNDEDQYEQDVSEMEQTVEFCKKYNDYIVEYVHSNQSHFYPDEDEQELEDIETSYKTKLFCPSEYDKNGLVMFVSFPFNNPDNDKSVRIIYKENAAELLSGSDSDKLRGQSLNEAIQSTDITKKLGMGTLCNIYLELSRVNINAGGDFKVQSTIHKRINVARYANIESSGSGGGSFRENQLVSDVDTSKIDMGDVITNARGGRSLKPKYGDKALTVTYKGKARFVKFQDKEDPSKFNYSVVINPSDEDVEHFNRINDFMFKDLLKNFNKYESGKTTENKLRKKWKPTVTKDRDGNDTMWFTIFTKKDETTGDTDFCGNFYKDDGTTRYDNDEVQAIFGEEYNVAMNIYFKHIWFGAAYYSAKFNMSSVKLSVETVDYDYDDDTYCDNGQEPSSGGDDNDDLDSPTEETPSSKAPVDSDDDTDDDTDDDDSDSE